MTSPYETLIEYNQTGQSQNSSAIKTKGHLVILSIPFTRIGRLLLSEDVLTALLKEADVLVVSPHANMDRFRIEFGRQGLTFLYFDPKQVYRSRVRGVFYALTELLRMRGFHRRFRKSITNAYWVLRHVTEGNNGVYTKKPWLTRFVTSFAGFVGGVWPGAWRALEGLSGRWLFETKDFETRTRPYECATLVQSACFGEQDRFLAFAARRLGFRTVLVPYTTDQLTINGYLMSDFDILCLQSAWEAGFATRFHRIAADRIRVIGNLWFRHIDRLRESIDVQSKKAEERVILLAGISTTVFPRASEFLAVETIVRAIEIGHLPGARLVYRPVIERAEDYDEVVRRYGAHPAVELQIPQASCLGILQYPQRPLKAELLEYVRQLLAADIMIMCFQTSICLDAAYLGRPVISYCADPTGMMKRPYPVQALNDDLGRIRASGVPEIHTIDQLIPAIADALADRNRLLQAGNRLLNAWDVQTAASTELLLEAVFSSANSEGQNPIEGMAIAASDASARERAS